MGLWDSIQLDMSKEFFKFEEVGDEIEGTVSGLDLKKWPDGGQTINVTFAEEDIPQLGASNIMLKQALFKLQPEIGEHLKVRFTGETTSGTKRMKRFFVAVTRSDGKVEELNA
jgi:hypothetical protein